MITVYIQPNFQEEDIPLHNLNIRNKIHEVKTLLHHQRSYEWLSSRYYVLKYNAIILDEDHSIARYGIGDGSKIELQLLDTMEKPPSSPKVQPAASAYCDSDNYTKQRPSSPEIDTSPTSVSENNHLPCPLTADFTPVTEDSTSVIPPSPTDISEEMNSIDEPWSVMDALTTVTEDSTSVIPPSPIDVSEAVNYPDEDKPWSHTHTKVEGMQFTTTTNYTSLGPRPSPFNNVLILICGGGDNAVKTGKAWAD